ncbi:hypothetical protein V6N13_015506 [Hibiscus sabdariffa]|uniref:Uncharacterized protein n=1 Tax=Hibiscus sabdariffa TaxID=183260 RepID=A0ABR2CYG7_9ROSI
MASSPKLLSLLFLFALFTIQIHAREFFSKIPREKESTVSLPNKEEQQEPRFSPETQNGYGLYGHEAETNTKETYEPYVTPVKFHPDEPYNMIPASKNSNTNTKDSYFYSKSAEESTEKENLGEARFTEKGWSTEENQNNNNNNNYYNGNNEETMFTEKGWSTNENNNNNYYNGNNEYNKNAYGESMFTEKGWSTKENNNNNNNVNNYHNGEKQGMSDTRFLENGTSSTRTVTTTWEGTTRTKRSLRRTRKSSSHEARNWVCNFAKVSFAFETDMLKI